MRTMIIALALISPLLAHAAGHDNFTVTEPGQAIQESQSIRQDARETLDEVRLKKAEQAAASLPCVGDDCKQQPTEPTKTTR